MNDNIDESVPLLEWDFGKEEWVPIRRKRNARRFAVSFRRISKPKEVK